MSSVQEHNERVLASLERGDAVEFKRGIYSHWALYIGDELVMHLSGNGEGSSAAFDVSSSFSISGQNFKKACVKKDKFTDVAKGSKAFKKNRKDSGLRARPVDEVIATAMSMEGEIGYNVLWNNCEHFVNYCRYGKKKSQQATRAIVGVVSSTATALAIFLGVFVAGVVLRLKTN